MSLSQEMSRRNTLCRYLNEDVLLEILSYLTLSDTVCFDYAIVNDPDYNYVLGLLQKEKWEITESQFYDNTRFDDVAILEWLNSRHIPVEKFASPFLCDDNHLELLSGSSPILTSVEIECGRNITDHGLKVLSRSCSSSLRHVILRGCTEITSEGLRDLSRCSRISSLHINAYGISGEALSHMTRLSNLEVLDLGGCNELTDDTMRGMHCPLLTSLVLRRCCNITSEGLRFISEGCPSLMVLDVGFCNHIGDSGLAFLSRCRSLRHLDMVLCISVTDIGLMHLSEGCALLEHLILSSCHKITSVGIMDLARGCPSLVHLDVGSCDITDEGLLHLSQGCTALQFLNLQSCRKVTQQGIQYLQNFPAMIESNTTGCNQPAPEFDFHWE